MKFLWYALAALIGLALLAMQTIDYINFGIDDVFISLRVAQNAAHGLGFVYNAGEYVEGVSNMLWTALLAASAWTFSIDYDRPYTLLWIAKGLSYGFGLATLVVLYLTARTRLRDNYFALLTVIALIGTGPFVLWMCGALETTLCAFFLTFSVYLVQRFTESRSMTLLSWIAIVLFLASITRPEPALHSVIVIAILFLSAERSQRKTYFFRLALPYGMLMAMFLAWRWSTYHDLVPNTFYAKTFGGLMSYALGFKYLLAGLMFLTGPLLLAVIATVVRTVKTDLTVQYCLGLILSTSFFVFYSGGDWMAGYRFIIPIAPILMLLGMETIKRLIGEVNYNSRMTMAGVAVMIAVILTGNVFAGRQSIKGSIQTMKPGYEAIIGHSVEWHEEIARWIQANGNTSGTIATGEAGMIGYLNPHMRLIDLYGLLDKKIAKAKKNNLPVSDAYLFDQKPDYILLYPREYTYNLYDYSSVVAMSPRLKSEYTIQHRFISLDLYSRNTSTIQ